MKKLFCIVILIFTVQHSFAQKIVGDSLVSRIKKDSSKIEKTFKFSDLKAKTVAGERFFNSLALPGLGQIKNKQYIYLPVIYGGLGAGIYFFSANFKRYKYFEAKRLESFGSGTTDARIPVKIDKYFNQGSRTFLQSELKPASDGYRRNLDITVLGITFGWLLQALQANVGYHLKTFETKDDISFKFQPQIMNLGNSLTYGVAITYKIPNNIK